MKKPKDFLIFPLDVSSYVEAIRYIDLLKVYVGIFKVGLELFVSVGPKIFKAIKERSNARIFLDLKFHDIPTTVKGAFLAASKYGISFATVHCDGGKGLLQAVVDNNPFGVKILAVTVLTSLGAGDLGELGYRSEYIEDIAKLVLLKAKLARDAGCSGLVCSGLEIEKVKSELGNDFIAVIPGIRPAWSLKEKDDQKRIMTPGKAIEKGADYIVIGRPIRTAKDPAEAAKKVLEEIETVIPK